MRNAATLRDVWEAELVHLLLWLCCGRGPEELLLVAVCRASRGAVMSPLDGGKAR